MRRLLVLIAGLGIFLLSVLPAPRALADSDDDSITRYAVTADVAKDGTTTVTLANIDELVAKRNATPVHDAGTGEATFEYQLQVTDGTATGTAAAPNNRIRSAGRSVGLAGRWCRSMAGLRCARGRSASALAGNIPRVGERGRAQRGERTPPSVVNKVDEVALVGVPFDHQPH